MTFNPINGQLYTFDNAETNSRMGAINLNLKRVNWYGAAHPEIRPITALYFDSFGRSFGISSSDNSYWRMPANNNEEKYSKRLGLYSEVVTGDGSPKDDRMSCGLNIQMTVDWKPLLLEIEEAQRQYQKSRSSLHELHIPAPQFYSGGVVLYEVTIANPNNFAVTDVEFIEEFLGDMGEPRLFVADSLVNPFGGTERPYASKLSQLSSE